MESMEGAGLRPIGEYIRRQQADISERADFRPIYDIYTEAERMPGTSRTMKWWDQDVVKETDE